MKEIVIAKYLAGECSEDEKREIEKLIQSSPLEEQEYQEMKKIWSASERFTPDSRAAFKIVDKKISEGSDNRMKKVFYWAAAILILGIGVYFLNNFYNIQKWETVSALNEKKNVVLPDGSSVWLNTNSSLKYSITDNGDRVCHLNGEAYFEVTKMESRPFSVETNYSRIQVIGTSFNINNKTEAGQDILSVTSGKVSFSEKNTGDEEVIVAAGQSSVYTYSTHSIKTQKIDLNSLSWKTGILQFSNMTLNEVAEVLKEYYNTKIEVDPSIQTCLLNATITNLPLEDALIVIQKTLNVDYEVTKEAIYIKGKKCRP